MKAYTPTRSRFYTYSVEEVRVAGSALNSTGGTVTGTDSHGHSFTVTYEGNSYDPTPATVGGDSVGGIIGIINTYDHNIDVTPVTLPILKVDDADEPMSGIIFRLAGDILTPALTETTDENGQASFTVPATALGLHNGADDTDAAATPTTRTLTLTETNVPEGYTSDSPWTITIVADGITTSGSDITYKWKIASIQGASGTALTAEEVSSALRYKIVNTDNSGGKLALAKLVTVGGETTSGTEADGDYTFYLEGWTAQQALDMVSEDEEVRNAVRDPQLQKRVVVTVTGGKAVSATIEDISPEAHAAVAANKATADGSVSIDVTNPGGGTSTVAVNWDYFIVDDLPMDYVYSIREAHPTNGSEVSRIYCPNATAYFGDDRFDDPIVTNIRPVTSVTAQDPIEFHTYTFTNNKDVGTIYLE